MKKFISNYQRSLILVTSIIIVLVIVLRFTLNFQAFKNVGIILEYTSLNMALMAVGTIVFIFPGTTSYSKKYNKLIIVISQLISIATLLGFISLSIIIGSNEDVLPLYCRWSIVASPILYWLSIYYLKPQTTLEYYANKLKQIPNREKEKVLRDFKEFLKGQNINKIVRHYNFAMLNEENIKFALKSRKKNCEKYHRALEYLELAQKAETIYERRKSLNVAAGLMVTVDDIDMNMKYRHFRNKLNIQTV